MRKALSFVTALLFAGAASAQLYPAKPQPKDFAPAAGRYSNIYVVDPVNGSDSFSCLSFEQPCLTLAAAYAKTTTAQHDTVLVVAGATALTPAAAITWSKNYTHLVGVGSPLPGMGQRARIVGNTTLDATAVVTFSGSGCIVKNVQIYNGADNAADNGAAVVSGDRNYFENVFVAGMGDATASGAMSRAGGYSLKVSGAENTFKDCTIGLDTVVRTAANAELHVSGVRNRFIGGDIRSNSVTAGKFLVKIDNSGGDLRDTIFQNVLFYNYTANWATGITDAIDMPAAGTSTANVILRGCQLVGVGTGWADVVTHVYSDSPAPNAGFGISAAPTT